MARAIVVGGGAFSPALLPAREVGDLLIAADSGYRHLHAAGIEPDICIGDWDSLDSMPRGCESITLPVAKDDTDLVAAARLGWERGQREFLFLGALGGTRFSHSVAAVQALAWLAAEGAACELRDPLCTLYTLRDAVRHFPADAAGHLSVFSLTDRAVVTLEGLWYSAEHLELTSRFPLGVSNAFTGVPAAVAAESGILLLVEEPDAG